MPQTVTTNPTSVFSKEKIDHYVEILGDKIVGFIPSILLAIGILIAGLIAIKFIRKFITRIITARPDHDPTLLKFILDVSTWALRILLFVTIIDKLGVGTTSFAAIIGAGAVAIGLSLQGSLSNFAGGLLIILFKPFRVGDYIEAQGQGGTVSSIQIFSTRLITSNNQVVYLPNGTLSNNTIKNFSQEPLRRAEILLNIAYSNDLSHVKNVIFKAIKADEKVLQQPKPAVEIKALTDSAIQVGIYIWAERAKYGAMVSDFHENIKDAFEQNGVELPTSHQDVSITYTNKNPETK
ncbi:mechanosensitive ion channel family protein [Flavobacterium sp. RNTU_13]|uniref:mechanosensitive ion channel family protein n=1 Tax=Flavobacterium sp. RNTU_13 TaxID=3375145 RepID=UPI0039874FE5